MIDEHALLKIQIEVLEGIKATLDAGQEIVSPPLLSPILSRDLAEYPDPSAKVPERLKLHLVPDCFLLFCLRQYILSNSFTTCAGGYRPEVPTGIPRERRRIPIKIGSREM